MLSDHRKRTMYDAGLYDPEDQEDEVGDVCQLNFVSSFNPLH